MWELDCREMLLNCGVGEDSWVPWTARRSNESILKRSVLVVHWKDYVEAETPVLWPPDAKSWLICKDPDAGKDWGQEEKGTTEDEMVGWHHWLNGQEFEWTLGVDDGQGGLAYCSPWGRQESDMTERLNWLTEYNIIEFKLEKDTQRVLSWDACIFQYIEKHY